MDPDYFTLAVVYVLILFVVLALIYAIHAQ